MTKKLPGETPGKKTPEKPTRSKPKQAPAAHESLKHLQAVTLSVDDPDSLEETGLDSQRLYYQIYRVGPQSLTQGRRMYLKRTWETPDEEFIKNEFGGGEFYIQVHENGRLGKGSIRIAIEGEPKIAKPAGNDETLPEMPNVGSNDPVVGLLVQYIEKLSATLLSEIRQTRHDGTQPGELTPEKLRKLLAVANESRLTNMLLTMGVAGDAGSSSISEQSVNQRVEQLFKFFKMGMELRPDAEPESQEGFMGILAPILKQVFNPRMAPAQPADGVNTHGMLAPTQAVPGWREPAQVTPGSETGSLSNEQIEQERKEYQENVTELRQEKLLQKLYAAVGTMLTAIEAETEYSNAEIIDFILKQISESEVRLIGANLTFENVRQLLGNDADGVICLDDNKEKVVEILSELKNRLGL